MALTEQTIRGAGAAEGPNDRRITFDTHPDRYRHWQLSIDGRVATLALDVKEDGGLVPGYTLKMNSYDLGVDIELHDAMQRLRFEHPEVAAVVIRSGKAQIFCAGANISMLAQSSHPFKVNFCKFTNETRVAMEEATEHSGQTYLCAVNGAASGGGYELALATDHILLIDDSSSAVSLPELPLLAVLPGTGGLTRLVDKRKVRRDHADVLCTLAEGIRGKRSVEWRLVDELVPKSRFDDVVRERAEEAVARSDRPADGDGVELVPLDRRWTEDELVYPHLRVEIDREDRFATFVLHAPEGDQPGDSDAILAAGASWWPLAVARELDDAILLLRHNEVEIGTWVFKTEGDPEAVAAVDEVLLSHADHWLVREVVLLWRRTLKRLDVSSRSLVALVEPGSCFAGTLLELVFAADRSFMLDGTFEDDDRPPAAVMLTGMNFGPLPMGNGLTRLETRFLGEPHRVGEAGKLQGEPLEAADADSAGLVTYIPDDIDWEDEVRIFLEERSSFSPDALTGMEASLRFAGPETLETKIFGRLTAWQNWIFTRPNASGEEGALRRYGTGVRGTFDKRRA